VDTVKAWQALDRRNLAAPAGSAHRAATMSATGLHRCPSIVVANRTNSDNGITRP
jgi:hypothetical protein